MGHCVSLFVGPKAALRPFIEAVPAARMYALTPAAPLFVLPLTDAVHDGLHARYGTGEWIELPNSGTGLRLSSSDVEFASAASRHSALAWVMTDYFGGQGEQAACAWIDGAIVLKPVALKASEGRPQPLRPINAALRVLGVKAGGKTVADDEFAVFGLPAYRSNEAILARAIAVTP